MENISLVRYAPNNGDYALTAQLVECYRDVFADGPWHEWLKCSKCQKYWGTKDIALLASNKFRHCDVPLVDFYPRNQVVCDLYHEITSEASCWLTLNNGLVIGFCWGYPITVAELEAKLGVSIRKQLGHGDNEMVAYQDEVGVLSEYRGRKIAKAMVARRLKDFLAQGLKVGVVRTRQTPEPSETFLWYTQKLGYRIIAHYPGEDGRVVLCRELDGLQELMTS